MLSTFVHQVLTSTFCEGKIALLVWFFKHNAKQAAPLKGCPSHAKHTAGVMCLLSPHDQYMHLHVHIMLDGICNLTPVVNQGGNQSHATHLDGIQHS